MTIMKDRQQHKLIEMKRGLLENNEMLKTLGIIILLGVILDAGDPSARVRGDLIVGALFSVHRPPSAGQGALVCGRVREHYGIQRVEAALITLDHINRDNNILPGVKLGLEARDSCWSAPVALQQSIELVRDAITPTSTQSHFLLTSTAFNYNCQINDTTIIQREFPLSMKSPIVGVVGPGSSTAALQVQNLLQLFSIPQIGYSPTSRDLSDKSRYSTFLRVVPSDYYQAQLLVDLAQHFNWTYVSTVNTDENYGQSGMQAFRELAEKNGICVAREDAVLSNAEDTVFEDVLANLDQDKAAKVVICFCEGLTMRKLLNASKTLNLTGRFLYIGSDGWADRNEVTEHLENEAWGSLSIRIYSPYVKEFDQHYFSLNPFNNSRNPWFIEFWQYKFNCIMPDSLMRSDTSTEFSQQITNKTICTGREKLSEGHTQDPKMSFVMKSFWAMAHGLHSMLEDICGRAYYGVCNDVYPFNATLFKNHLMNISFTFGDEEVEFDRQGDPPGRYEILNFRKLSNGSYGYVQIGDWHNGSLVLYGLPQTRGAELITSVCSQPCPAGYYKNFKTGGQEKKCCWACVPCDRHEFVDEYQLNCVPCPYGQWPNENKTDCDIISMEYTLWSDMEAIVAIFFSLIGLIATFITFHIFIKHNDTPVVKASTRELSYLILAAIALAHTAVFPILAKPTQLSCTLVRSMPGISFAMMYASLFTKTNRIARILAGSKKRFPKRKLLFMSAATQIAITSFLIMMEVVIVGIMLVLESPQARLIFPSRERAVLTCAMSVRALILPLAFDGILVALCTLYAVKTRNVPENFNEAKFIGFAMYTTCVIWIAFVSIYFGSEAKIITMSICVTLSASVILIFLFFPKLYIIILKPQKNNRAFFTTSKSIRCHIGAQVAAAIAEPSSSQAIYCISGYSAHHHYPNNDTSSTAPGHNNSITMRTISVQTEIELLVNYYKSHGDILIPSPIRLLASSHDSKILLPTDEFISKYRKFGKPHENLDEKDSYKNLAHSDMNVSVTRINVSRPFKSDTNLAIGLISHRSKQMNRPTIVAELDARTFRKSHRIMRPQKCNSIGNWMLPEKQLDDMEIMQQPKINIREEFNHININGEPIINITITLGTKSSTFM